MYLKEYEVEDAGAGLTDAVLGMVIVRLGLLQEAPHHLVHGATIGADQPFAQEGGHNLRPAPLGTHGV